MNLKRARFKVGDKLTCKLNSNCTHGIVIKVEECGIRVKSRPPFEACTQFWPYEQLKNILVQKSLFDKFRDLIDER